MARTSNNPDKIQKMILADSIDVLRAEQRDMLLEQVRLSKKLDSAIFYFGITLFALSLVVFALVFNALK